MSWIRRHRKWKHGDPVWVDMGGFPAFYRTARKGVVLGYREKGRVLVRVNDMGSPVSITPDRIWARADFPQSQAES